MSGGMKFKIAHNFQQVQQLLSRYPEVYKNVAEMKVTDAILLLQQVVKDLTPEGAGPIHLRTTIHERIILEGSRVIGITGTACPYAEPVEYGTEPHFPPIAPLKFWFEGKLHLPEKEAERAAWALAIKIADVGTEGAHMFEYGWEDAQVRVLRILDQIPEEMIRQLTNGA